MDNNSVMEEEDSTILEDDEGDVMIPIDLCGCNNSSILLRHPFELIFETSLTKQPNDRCNQAQQFGVLLGSALHLFERQFAHINNTKQRRTKIGASWLMQKLIGGYGGGGCSSNSNRRHSRMSANILHEYIKTQCAIIHNSSGSSAIKLNCIILVLLN